MSWATRPAMSETELWASCGAMALTGRAAGPALLGTGSPASAVHAALNRISAAGVARVPGVQLLGERAALTGAGRNAPWSAGGSFRILPALDGWLGVSLARPADVSMLPALVEDDVSEPWPAIGTWLRRTPAGLAAARAQLLGLPAAEVPARPAAPVRPPVVVTPGGSREPVARPFVLDFSALWAGPLAAHLLGLAGARVVKVESRTRPDGARSGSLRFFDLLQAGHEAVALDFTGQRQELGRLVARADVIIEASRPRALAQLGIDATREVARGAIWVSITAAGRDHGLRAGFGDDVAAGAGLVAWEDGVPYPMADALADPLSGITAAAAAIEALSGRRGALIDVSMHDVCAAAAVAPRTGPADVIASAPAARTPRGAAVPMGHDTARVLAEPGPPVPGGSPA